MLRTSPRLAVALATVLCLAAWIVLVLAGAVLGWWHRAIAPAGDAAAFVDAAKQLIDSRNRGNVAFRLIEGGLPKDDYFVSIGAPVITERVFHSRSSITERMNSSVTRTEWFAFWKCTESYAPPGTLKPPS